MRVISSDSSLAILKPTVKRSQTASVFTNGSPLSQNNSQDCFARQSETRHHFKSHSQSGFFVVYRVYALRIKFASVAILLQIFFH